MEHQVNGVPLGRHSLARKKLHQPETFQQLKEQSNKSGSNKQNAEEEANIRAELEMDIEKDLEDELKAQICRLALRLHRLYQHQHQHQHNKHITKTKKKSGVSEIKIRINKDGETKVDIIEMNKKPPHHRVVPLHVPKQNNSKYGAKKFEWTKSLRSGHPKSSIQVIRSKVDGAKQGERFPRGSRTNQYISLP
ncbi:hypothetical protein RND81_06G003200 [Saponaria officinalis]|uniref:Uncharacterized protein n=1 Tax=Saponaria officinalis TaxID=3572 RepID=A0AAW1K665_SAPOF